MLAIVNILGTLTVGLCAYLLLREDWELGRVYLPADELARFGVGEDDIAAGRVTAEWVALMSFQYPSMTE